MLLAFCTLIMRVKGAAREKELPHRDLCSFTFMTTCVTSARQKCHHYGSDGCYDNNRIYLFVLIKTLHSINRSMFFQLNVCASGSPINEPNVINGACYFDIDQHFWVMYMASLRKHVHCTVRLLAVNGQKSAQKSQNTIRLFANCQSWYKPTWQNVITSKACSFEVSAFC